MNPLDILISIPGPLFLFYFILLSVLCIFIGRWLAFRDGTDVFPMPDAQALDHIEISLMRGGRAAAVQAAIFELWQKNLLSFKDGSGREIVSVESENKIYPSMQAVIYGFFRGGRKTTELFKSRETMEAVDVYIEAVYQKLEMMGLMLPAKDRYRINLIFLISLLLIFGAGLTKLYFGLKFGRPVAFLVILLFLSFMSLMIAFRPFKKKRLSRLGAKYLNFIKEHFSWLKQAVSKGDDIPSFNSALFGVAIFGVTFLAGMETYDAFNKAFPHDFSGESLSVDSGGSGGCSSSDGDGGGCGGGGCGGCGGGGD